MLRTSYANPSPDPSRHAGQAAVRGRLGRTICGHKLARTSTEATEATEAAGWPRLAEAPRSLRRGLAPREAAEEPAGRGLSRPAFVRTGRIRARRRHSACDRLRWAYFRMGHARGGRGDLGANRGVDWEPSQHSLGPAVAVNCRVRYAPYLPLRPGKRKPPTACSA